MKHIISLELDELNPTLIEKLKGLYDASKARLTIILEDEEDETEFLLQSENNRQRLMKSIENIEKGNVITPDLNEFREKARA